MNYLKAIAAGIYASIMVLVPIIDDGLKASEILAAIAAGLVGAGLVYAVPNKSRG